MEKPKLTTNEKMALLLKRWAEPGYVGVMLPGSPLLTCDEVAAALATPDSVNYALERALSFIDALTEDPLLMGDDIEMRLEDVQANARIELDSIRKQLSAAPSSADPPEVKP